jgi:hypothetical protein
MCLVLCSDQLLQVAIFTSLEAGLIRRLLCSGVLGTFIEPSASWKYGGLQNSERCDSNLKKYGLNLAKVYFPGLFPQKK